MDVTSTSARAWTAGNVPAEGYQRGLVPVLFEPWARELVVAADLRAGERVLDLACGTGVVARTAAGAAPLGNLIGVDVNADMLAVARATSASTSPPIIWRQADASDTGLPDGVVDVVLCQQGLQFFPDRPAALAEMHRLLAPGGRVALSVWNDPASPGYAGFAPAFRRHVPDLPQAVDFLRAIFALHDPAELHDLLAAAGFRRIHVSRETRLVRCASVSAWVTTFLQAAPVPGLAAVPSSAVQRITDDVDHHLADHVGPDGLAFPMSANVATAVR